MSVQFLSTEPCHWQHASDIHLKPLVGDWLLDEKSLTAKLSALPGTFSVELIGQAVATPFANERSEFPQQTHFIIREVLLKLDEQPFVFARSVFPISAADHENLNLGELGTQSLGQSLFNQSDLKRSTFEVTQLPLDHGVSQINRHYYQQNEAIWGRRSLFNTQGQHVLVSEFFLSPVPIY
ncbi:MULTISPECIES: chorismate lyase [unclassified Idiomarina]|jgi:chorismate--pyruvate lyase|uniref:chorismate--pyruvate lyase family protein n=1 Tax=unclassified Idiomarina TaxID=2614829 RepID=UPI000C98DA0A|nr:MULTISPECIES: chorismate lyase [unclassified Idiomarina]MAD53512.1 chorismate--pyruvate lyase [Idiomarinaceae bacterium]MEC7642812.1 chorismate lyase [Pseudomonadota bacterium]NQZ03178.1 chorismate lyase [Idiomarina sp.]|tara:strand:- start:13382 stop:13924 length:543 start_codon:yes stop_codon:yes gene_type:complete